MGAEIIPKPFRQGARKAVANANLKIALDRTTGLLKTRRAAILETFADYAAARDQAAAIKAHTLDNWAFYLQQFEQNAQASGAVVHWAETAEQASQIAVAICQAHNAKRATRVKSMLGEEIGLPRALEAAGIESVETDLAEHIIQLAKEPPSHIIIPAMHKRQEEVAALFQAQHATPPDSFKVEDLVGSARRELRLKFGSADVGISGANFLVAETGSIVTVTNEGNGELTCELPELHIVTAGIEKIVPRLEDTSLLLRLLSRSALGTEFTQYTTFYTGPRRAQDTSGPKAMHIILVDAGRSALAETRYRDMLRCIRCGACMNHCPVYGEVGGHSYAAVYPGPMGAILTPTLRGLETAKDLPQACTLNGRCQDVCPVKIPLADMIRELRQDVTDAGMTAKGWRLGLGIWSLAAARPWLYRCVEWGSSLALRILAAGRGHIRTLPLAGAWSRSRDLLAPADRTFLTQYRRRKSQVQSKQEAKR